jgi:hypothetical protein
MSAAPSKERKAADLAHALDLPMGEHDRQVVRDALPTIRGLVEREIQV